MKYTFNAPESPIKEVEILAKGKHFEAVTPIADDISAENIALIQQRLTKMGYVVMTGAEESRAVLRISNIKTANNLLVDMENASAVIGDFVTKEPENQEKTDKKAQGAHKNPLLVAGASYLAGDTSVIVAGLMRGDSAEVIQGIVWAIPSVALMVNATQTADSRMGYLYRDFNAFLEKNAIETPPAMQQFLHQHEAKNDLLRQTQRFFNDHGTVFNDWMQVTGALCGIQAGINQKNPFKSIASAIMGTGMALGAILPEGEQTQQRHTEHLGNALSAKPYETLFVPNPPNEQSGLVDWYLEKPHRIAGHAALTQNMLKLAGTFLIDNTRQAKFEGDKNTDGSLKKDGEYHTETTKWNKVKQEAIAGLNNLPEDSTQEQKAILSKQYNDNLDKSRDEIRALDERKKEYYLSDKAAWADRASFGFYMLANTLYAKTEKNNGADLVKSGGVNQIIEVAANIIADAPPAKRNAYTIEMASFLANHPYVPQSVEELTAHIEDKVSILTSLAQRTTLERIYNLDTQKAVLEDVYLPSGVQVKDKIHAGKIAMNQPALAASF